MNRFLMSVCFCNTIAYVGVNLVCSWGLPSLVSCFLFTYSAVLTIRLLHFDMIDGLSGAHSSSLDCLMRVLDVRRKTKHGVGAALKCGVAFWGCECGIMTGLRCSESSMRRRRSGIISEAGLLQLKMEHPRIYYNINGTDHPIARHLASARCLFPTMKPPNICISYSARDQSTNSEPKNSDHPASLGHSLGKGSWVL
jgi:hypothetical protein